MHSLPCLGNTPAVTLKASTHGDSNPLHSQCATATKGSGDIWLHGTKMLGQYNPEAALQHQTPAGLCQKTGQFNSGAASTPQLALQHPSLVTGSLMFWATEKKKNISVPITSCGSENLNQNLQTLELPVTPEAVNAKAPV